MTYQLRSYTLKPETADEFVELWERDLVPLRLACQFTVVGAWREPARDGFVWIVRWDGEGSFADGEAAYYKARDEAQLGWSPGDYLASIQLQTLEALPDHAP